VRLPVVDDPVDRPCTRVGLLGHDAFHERHERDDAGLLGDRADETGAMDVIGTTLRFRVAAADTRQARLNRPGEGRADNSNSR
jgi:hypothetical protein